MRRWQSTLARLSAVAMLASLLALVGNSSAQATSQAWTAVQLTGMAQAQNVLTTPAGNAVVSCSYYNTQNAIKVVNADGSSGATYAHLSSGGLDPDACDGVTAVGVDGTIFTVAYDSSTNAYYLAAYKNGSGLWATSLTASCSWNFPKSIMVGNDGNVYAAIENQGMCSSQGRRLRGFNSTTGASLFDVGLGNTQSLRYNGLLPYANGLVVSWGTQFRYFDYSGNEQSSSAEITLASGELIVRVVGGTGGRVFAMVAKNQSTTSTCPYSQVLSRIVALNASGDVWQYNAPACWAPGELDSTPSNGVSYDAVDDAGNVQLYALNASGVQAWLLPYTPSTGNDGVHNFNISGIATYADNNGNVVVQQRYRSMDGQRYGVQVSVLDGGTGRRKAVFYTDELTAEKSFNAVYLGLASGRIYLIARVCDNGSCNGNVDPYLYAVNAPGIGMDFPRASALGQVSQPPAAEKEYVALGDSFSSGEGVPPFDSASTSNGCHRSTRAYAQLLNASPSQSLALQAFVACSGATTGNVLNGQNGENPQVNSLGTSTDIVTITIGGNDIGFVDFLIACVNPLTNCDTTSAAYATAMDKITNDLPDSLDGLYTGQDGIQDRVGTGTRVLVVGYPRVVPYDDSLLTCGILSADERTAARQAITGLNTAIRDAVTRAGSQFEFVDANAIINGVRVSPFATHEYCSDDSYFNGIGTAVADPSYAMHPNVAGQAAYEQLVSHYLATHP